MRDNHTEIAQALTSWFDLHARVLPWREDPAPYRVWVSEIMLQQTRVTTVIPYFHAFLERFPNVRSLAQAPLDEVLAAWAGLGYYRRARTLHRAARSLGPDYAMPTTLEDLLEVPGIGRYTAGAIASIAYGLDAPIVDGNVMRVLCRLFGLRGDPYGAALNRTLWSLAEAMIPVGRASPFNQSMMELGALVCVPRGPRCGTCPVEDFCAARREGIAEELPERRRRSAPKEMHLAVLIARDGEGRLLVQRRDEAGLFGGMWAFPAMETAAGEGSRASATVLADAIGLEGAVGTIHAPITRQLTHRTLVLSAVEIAASGGLDGGRWVTPEELHAVGMPAAFQAVAAHIGAGK